MFFFVYLEVKDKASEKVDQGKDKANEVATDAKKKGEGNRSWFKKNIFSIFLFY